MAAAWLCPWESEDPDELDDAGLGEAEVLDPESAGAGEPDGVPDEASLGVEEVVELLVPRLSFL